MEYIACGGPGPVLAGWWVVGVDVVKHDKPCSCWWWVCQSMTSPRCSTGEMSASMQAREHIAFVGSSGVCMTLAIWCLALSCSWRNGRIVGRKDSWM